RHFPRPERRLPWSWIGSARAACAAAVALAGSLKQPAGIHKQRMTNLDSPSKANDNPFIQHSWSGTTASSARDCGMAATPAGPATEPTTSSWRRWLVILVCLAVVGLGGFLAWQWLHDQSERREALRVATQGDFSRSEPLLLRIAQRHPNDAPVAKELAL